MNFKLELEGEAMKTDECLSIDLLHLPKKLEVMHYEGDKSSYDSFFTWR